MNVESWLLWGLVATGMLTMMASAGRRMHMTRMNMPYMLGTLFTGHRDRAVAAGFAAHFVNGLLFSLIYVFIFESLGLATWWTGALLGLLHAGFVLIVVIPGLPHMHPRMASEVHGPSPARQLEPPGFLALHYGPRTPIAMTLVHIIYGAILGGFYVLS